MILLHTLLPAACLTAAILWVALTAYVVLTARRRDRAQSIVARAVAALEGAEGLPLEEQLARIRPLVAPLSRDSIMRAVADLEMSGAAAAALAACIVDRWGLEALERAAASHQTPGGKWRRMTALRVLFHLDSTKGLPLLGRALNEADGDVASVALSLLGASTDPAAAELLIEALKARHHPRSRIAAHVDRSPQHLAARLQPLLTDVDPLVRRWSATLLGRYGDVAGLTRDLAAAADDPDPRVRKAALESLARIGDGGAARTALRLMNDPVPMVRAAAAYAIGALDRPDLTRDVAVLLGDRDWAVRAAAKECLEGMGPDIWPVLVKLLDDPDRFVRNGAAEVFQNLGLLDSFIVMEAATDSPAQGKIELLRRIVAAGELRLTDSLFERIGPALGPRVRRLLMDVGLEHVGAA